MSERFWQGLKPSAAELGKQLFGARTATHDGAFFLRHLRPGMDLLDCGCAEGSITLGLAEAVAPGRVTGIDLREASIEQAGSAAAERGLSNVSFQQASVYELPFEGASFDAVFAHALFEWLSDRPRAVAEFYRVLKPGGLVGLRSPDKGTIWWPEDDRVDQFWSVFSKWRAHIGADDPAGRKLVSVLQRGGFVINETSISGQPRGVPGATKWYGEWLAAILTETKDFRDVILAEGWVDEQQVEQMAEGLRRTSAEPGAFIVSVMCDVVASKPGG